MSSRHHGTFARSDHQIGVDLYLISNKATAGPRLTPFDLCTMTKIQNYFFAETARQRPKRFCAKTVVVVVSFGGGGGYLLCN
jgi:hypothetical protein